jgi:hypothetical protein
MQLEDLKLREYVGDGAYIGHDGYQVWIVSHDGISITNKVAIEPGSGEEAVIKYLKHMQEMRRAAG